MYLMSIMILTHKIQIVNIFKGLFQKRILQYFQRLYYIEFFVLTERTRGMTRKINKRKSTGSALLFKTVSDEWFLDAETRLKLSTIANYKYLLEKHILPYFSDMKMRRLTVAEVNGFIVQKLVSGKLRRNEGISGKYLRDMLSIIRSISRFCEEIHGIKCKIRDMKSVKAEKPEIRILDRDEKKALTHELRSDTTPEKVGIMLGLYTGLRIGEVCGLKWEDYNERRSTITVNRTVQRIYNTDSGTVLHMGTPKTQSSHREIPLPDIVSSYLSKMKKEPEAFIVSDSGGYTDPSRLRRVFKRILNKCDLGELRFHDLRHTFASDCARLNFDTKILSEILGHSSVSITLDRYVHSDLETKREYMQLIKAL